MDLFLLSLVLLFVAYVCYKYWRAARRFRPLTDEYHHAGGNSATLTCGRISYQWHGPEDGEIVLLAHGFATAKFVWDKTIPELSAAGYRVLSFDHFGRGHSDRPRTAYSRDFYINEVRELLDILDVKQPITLIGYSMGGAVVSCFAAAYPERVKQLILLAPAAFVPPPKGALKLLTLPLIGEMALTAGGADLLLEELYNAVKDGRISEDLVKRFKEQFYIQGTPYALASTLRHLPMTDLSDDIRRIGELDLKVSAVWGSADRVTPIEGADQIRELVPKLKLYRVEGAGHDFTYTRPHDVNPSILAELRSKEM